VEQAIGKGLASMQYRFLLITRTLQLILFLSLTVLADSVAAERAQRESHQQTLNQLVENFWRSPLRRNVISEEHRQKRRGLYSTYLNELSKIERGGLLERDRLNYDSFKYELTLGLEALQFNDHLIPDIRPLSRRLALSLWESGDDLLRFKTVKGYDTFLNSMNRIRTWADTAIANMRKGMAVGIVESRYVMERALPQVGLMIVSDVKESVFYQPILHLPASIDEAEKVRLTQAYTKAIEQTIIPTYRKLHSFLKDEYLPKCRASVGISALPGGSAWYSHLVKATTTTNLTPDEIFQIGMDEIKRVKKEMEELREKTGFKGKGGFEMYLEQNAPKYSNKEDLIKAYEALRTEVTPRVRQLFGRLPRASYEIRAVEGAGERGAQAIYLGAAPDGSRPGVFYLDTFTVRTHPVRLNVPLFLHEAVPGHHLQESLQLEQTDLPAFRRYGDYIAFAEGWATYAASLGQDMGLYSDPYQHSVHLRSELSKALDLVLDVGIHHKGWSIQRAFAFATETTGQAALINVDRYIARPGRTLAYKIGQLKISAIRSKAEKTLGSKFDIRAFHDELLKDGPLPLDLLEAKMDAWIARQNFGPAKS
jgi:uncharacterized protein (DUF885 family)